MSRGIRTSRDGALSSWAAALVLLGGIGFGQEKANEPVFTVDDGAIRDRFQQVLETAIGEEGVPKGNKLLSRSPGPTFPAGELKKIGESAPAVPGEKTLSSPEIFARAMRGVLLVGHLYQCGKCDKWHPNIAGGVVIDPSGLAVTNFHVMDAPKAEVFGAMTADGEVFPIVEVLAASKSDDLAIIRLKTGGKKLEAIALAGDDPVGSEVRVISHPDGRFYTCSEGIVARYYFEPQAKAPRVQITADYAKGSSGSGVFNDRGALLGLVSSTTSIYYTQTPEEQRNLQMVVKSCIPVASIRKLLKNPALPKQNEATPEATATKDLPPAFPEP
jgi:serine protease Do